MATPSFITGSAQSTGATAASWTISHTWGGGWMVVFFGMTSAAAVTASTFGGVDFSAHLEDTAAGAANTSHLWVIPPSVFAALDVATAYDLTIAKGAGNVGGSLFVIEYADVLSVLAAVIGVAVDSFTDNFDAPDESMAVQLARWSGSPSGDAEPSSGQTERIDITGGSWRTVGEQAYPTAAASQSLSYSTTNADEIHHAFVLLSGLEGGTEYVDDVSASSAVVAGGGTDLQAGFGVSLDTSGAALGVAGNAALQASFGAALDTSVAGLAAGDAALVAGFGVSVDVSAAALAGVETSFTSALALEAAPASLALNPFDAALPAGFGVSLDTFGAALEASAVETAVALGVSLAVATVDLVGYSAAFAIDEPASLFEATKAVGVSASTYTERVTSETGHQAISASTYTERVRGG